MTDETFQIGDQVRNRPGCHPMCSGTIIDIHGDSLLVQANFPYSILNTHILAHHATHKSEPLVTEDKYASAFMPLDEMIRIYDNKQ